MITVTNFPQQQQPSKSDHMDYHGWPNAGGQPQSDNAWQDWNGSAGQWHAQDYNPYVQFTKFSDGTEFVYDAFTSTYSKSFAVSGNMEAHTPDGHIEHISGQKSELVGASHTLAVAGHSDYTHGGAHRTNIAGDSYQHTKGFSHVASLQGHVHLNPGNGMIAHGGTFAHYALSDNAGMGMAQGGGGSSPPNTLTMTKQLVALNAKNAKATISSGMKVVVNKEGMPGGMQAPATIFIGGVTFNQGFQVQAGQGATFMGGGGGGAGVA